MGDLSRALQISAGGAAAVGQRQGATADNVANVATIGYRRADVQFESLVDGHLARLGGGGGAGVRARPRLEVDGQGQIVPSTVDGDSAISGRGFFVVSDGVHQRLTRVGTFAPDAAGVLRNGNGFALMGWPAGAAGAGSAAGLQALSVPAAVGAQAVTGVQIAADGVVRAGLADGSSAVLGQVALATLANPDGMAALPGTVFEPTAASGAPVLQSPGQGAAGVLVGAAVEAPDVDLSHEMVDLVQNRATYAANIRALAVSARLTDTLLDIKS